MVLDGPIALAVQLAAEGAAAGLSVTVIAPYRKQVCRIHKRPAELDLDEQVQRWRP